MSSKTIRPTTVVGIKRLAKTLARQQSIPLSQAQQQAARLAGYENLRHAANSARLSAHSEQPFFVTAYWRNLTTGEEGRETLQMSLAGLVSRALASGRFRYCRWLHDFKLQAPDHLVCRFVVDRRDRARDLVCGASREVQFMQATGLTSKGKVAGMLGKIDHRDQLPGRDHSSFWLHEESGVVVQLDEPYLPAIASKEDARQAWADRHGLMLARTVWPGIHNPSGGSQLFLLGRQVHANVVEHMVERLNELQPGACSSVWEGDSEPYRPLWVSPGGQAREVTTRPPRDLRLVRKSKSSLPYGRVMVGVCRRPNGRLPLEVHHEMARLLKDAIHRLEWRASASGPLNTVRDDLDEWVAREHGYDELDEQTYSNLYFGSSLVSEPAPRQPTPEFKGKLLVDLAQMESLLTRHYPPSAPLRVLTNRLGSAKKAIEKWPLAATPRRGV